MKTTLNENGLIAIPQHICESDHLVPGDSFELERLRPGHYLLVAKRPAHGAHVSAGTGEDGLPVIRVSEGVITTKLVKELESQMP